VNPDLRIPAQAYPGLAWPPLSTPSGQAVLAALFQLDCSQWVGASRMRACQFEQLGRLVRHAVASVPFYRDHPARGGLGTTRALTPQSFGDWPILRKADVQSHRNELMAEPQPAWQGGHYEVTTSGSTGRPVSVEVSGTSLYFQRLLFMRSHAWHGVDPAGTLAVIRAVTPKAAQKDWGAPTSQVFRTGRYITNGANQDHSEQLRWLVDEAPDYLLAHNTNLRALVQQGARVGIAPKSLRVVMGFTDMAAPDLPALIAEHWKARYFDTYSCSEIGTLALQCPRHSRMHVQCEHVLMEILRPDGSACSPGEIGRVVITDLHNFAMPLIRYELGDQAAFGPPCPCGRGLPVIETLAGRTSDLAVDPTGRSFFAHLNQGYWVSLAPIRQRQIIQLAPDALEIRYVADRPLTEDEETSLANEIRQAMRYPYRIAFVRATHIPNGPGGKFVDFVSIARQAAS
jgi:phenylacetate-CoA ligase